MKYLFFRLRNYCFFMKYPRKNRKNKEKNVCAGFGCVGISPAVSRLLPLVGSLLYVRPQKINAMVFLMI